MPQGEHVPPTSATYVKDVSMNRKEAFVDTFVVPLERLGRDDLVPAGGKGANLGELVRAGFPVPDGFIITTAAYDGFVAHNRLGETIARALREQQGSGAGIRSAFEAAPIPPEIERDILATYRKLGEVRPVAVRSSATAEDLPGAAFAGQQDTFLNISDEQALLDAANGCWASLWTDRAIAYRERLGIDQQTVKLAIVVQQMIEAEVAGVLFTADPLTGKRRRAVIDASPGLGEAVVSGMVNPDHFVVHTATGEILQRRLGDKRVAVRAAAGSGTERFAPAGNKEEACLKDGQVRALAELGARVEAHYGAPQDTEWAIDADGRIWLLQARPITSLFPLPESAPATDYDLRVYFSFSVAQGVYRPLTPMGLQAFRLVASTIATTLAARPPRDPYAGPAFVAEAAGRLFLDVTPVLRDKLWRRLLDLAMRNMEARTAPILRRLTADPRLSPAAGRRWPVLRTLLSLLVRGRIPLRVAEALARPQAARDRAARVAARLRESDEMRRGAGAGEHLDAVERLLLDGPPSVPLKVIPVFIAGLAANALAGRLLGNLATDDERRAVLRGLPHNPTTEMDLALWALAQEARSDPDSARVLRETPPEQLAEDYHGGGLPPKLRTGLENFLHAYGHRGVAEIDLGLPRWSEDPAHVLGALANYLRLENPELAPDVQFSRAAREAKETATELTSRAGLKGRVRGRLVGFFLRRARALLGMREMPKFCFIILFSRIRELLWPVGEEMAEAGRLENAEDIFFVTLPEARAALGGDDLRPVVRERRSAYTREVRRRHVPRVLLSDGTEPATEAPDAPMAAEGVLSGTPASGGVVNAPARVILDPGGAVLEPGEVLVAPSTDPGWTPLFLTAGGLVMEMGGPMSHGAIVAREYGIPAVVGVADATERIRTGQEITVDGSAGTIATWP
jgi:pyruvate,water dikinase